jgi:ketosteroid isomerase-like protein
MAVDGRNIEAVRRIMETGQACVEGIVGPFEAALEEHCAADLVAVPASALAYGDPGPFRGRERLLEYHRAMSERWADFRVMPDEYVEVTPTTVVVLGKVSARSQDGSGYAMEFGIVSRLEEGRIVSMHSYPSKDRALAEAGAVT